MIADPSSPIGIFDSGVGGLTVANRVMQEMPQERIVYFGDTARAPYGIHTKERITAQTMQIMRFLWEKRPKIVIIACNTICVSSYYELVEEFNVPILEIVSPAAADCVTGGSTKVGVIATNATCKSEGYRIEIHKRNHRVAVFHKPCPDLVTLAERGLSGSAAGALQCELYLRSLKAEGIDSLILGCTHFPLFREHIAAYLGEKVRLVDPAVAATDVAKTGLIESGLINSSTEPPKHEFYVSGDPAAFEAIGKTLLGISVKAEQVDIEKY